MNPRMRSSRSVLFLASLWTAVLSTNDSDAAVESLDVEKLGYYEVADFYPWVADLWGYVDDQDREIAVLAAGNQLLVLDVTDPANIVLGTKIPAPLTASDLKDVKIWDHYAYACQEFGEILIVDIEDPYAASQVGAIPAIDLCYPSPCVSELDGGSHNLWIDDLGRLYICGVHWQGIRIYDLTVDPTAPTLIGSWDDRYFHDCYVADGILYAAGPGGGNQYWDIVDVSDAGNPSLIGQVTYPEVNYAHGCWVSGDHQWMYTTDEGAGGFLHIWDISDPVNGFEVATYEVGDGESSIHNVVLRGDHAFISYYEQGLRVLDVSDPTSPVEVGYYKDSEWDDDSCSFGVYRGNWGVYHEFPSGNILLSEMCGGGLYVMSFGGAPASAETLPVGDRIRLSSSPNPASGPIRFEATLELSGPTTLAIYDTRGRMLRSLARDRHLESGVSDLHWDGRDGNGRLLPNGTYYARLEQGRRSLTRKVTVQR